MSHNADFEIFERIPFCPQLVLEKFKHGSKATTNNNFHLTVSNEQIRALPGIYIKQIHIIIKDSPSLDQMLANKC